MLLLDRTTSLFSPVSRSILSILSVRASHQYSFPSCGDGRTPRLVWGWHYGTLCTSGRMSRGSQQHPGQSS